MTVGEDLKKIGEINMKENKKILEEKKKLLKLISDVVYDTVQHMKDEFEIYDEAPELKYDGWGASAEINIEADKAFIDEEYIVDNIYYNITGEDADGVR